MGTDAAFRFERGIDPEGVIRALDRAARLMAELSGGTVCQGVIDQYPRNIATAKEIPLRLEAREGYSGRCVSAEADVVRILRKPGDDGGTGRRRNASALPLRPAAWISPGRSISSRRSPGCMDTTGCRRPFPPFR